MSGKSSVWVLQSTRYLVLLHNRLDLVYQVHYSLVFLVGLSQSGLEAGVGVHQAGDLLDGVHDEHVHQVLACAVQPGNI